MSSAVGPDGGRSWTGGGTGQVVCFDHHVFSATHCCLGGTEQSFSQGVSFDTHEKIV